MAAQLAIQTAGNANSTPAEVETNTLAQRWVIRPQDFRTLGAYSVGGTYIYVNAMTSASTPATNAVLTTIRPQNTPGILYLVKRIIVSLNMFSLATSTGGNAAFTLALCTVENFVSQFVTASNNAATATLGKQLSPSTGCRLDSSMPSSTLDILMPPDAGAAAATVLLAPAAQSTVANVVPVVDTANPLAMITSTGGIGAVQRTMIQQALLFHQPLGQLPLILYPAVGLAVTMVTAPIFGTAAGTMVFSVCVNWEEVLMRDYD